MGLSGLVLRVQARASRPVPEPPVLIGSGRSTAPMGTRRPGRLARVEPYAPQLIRIVKTPYGLSPGWARRKRIREARERLQTFVRTGPVQQATEAALRPAAASPAGTRQRGAYPAVPRGLVARYLGDVDADGGSR